MRSVLVTGGAGYVGSHTCRALAMNGFLPITLDNLSTGHKWAVQWGPLEVGDIRDQQRIAAILQAHRPIAVMHFAAMSLVGESATFPLRYYDNNVSGTLSLLQAMLETGIDRFVFSSTCATYGQPTLLPIRETAAQVPINTYGRSKLMVETILRDCAAAHGIRATALRYFNAAGAASADQIGEAHLCETHLIPLVIDAALGHRGPVSVFGEDYATPDGSCQRDYIHVNDLARAHVLALQKLDTQQGFQAYNLGTGQPYSVKEVIAAVGGKAGGTVPHKIAPRRDGDPAALFADPSLARRELSWVPQESDLASIIESAWIWHTSFGHNEQKSEVRLAI